jgi:hypothetical protein
LPPCWDDKTGGIIQLITCILQLLASTKLFPAATFNIDRLGTVLSNVPEPGAWITREQLTDNAGRPASMPSWAPRCFGNGPGSKACLARMHQMYQVVVSYQPAGRFWTLQFWELGSTWRWRWRWQRCARTGSAPGCPDRDSSDFPGP